MTWNKTLKGRLPFRVGATSFVIPADIVPNVRCLAGIVDDIEILIFESDALAPLPDERALQELRTLAREQSLSYTVHLPLDADIGSRDERERRASVRKYLRVISHMAPLEPHGFIAHFPAPRDGATAAVRADWHAALACSAEELLAAGVAPRQLCVETLDYPFDWVETIIDTFHFAVCLDVGHALLHGHAIEPLLTRYLPRARVLHLHGVEHGKDHRSISAVDATTLSVLLSPLCNDRTTTRVLTLELFNAERLKDSLRVLAAHISRVTRCLG